MFEGPAYFPGGLFGPGVAGGDLPVPRHDRAVVVPDGEDGGRADHMGQYASKKGHASRGRATVRVDSRPDRGESGPILAQGRVHLLAASLLSCAIAMTTKSLLIVSLLVVSPVGPLYAQDDQNGGDKPAPTVRMPDGSRERVGPATGSAVARPAPQPAPAAAPAPAPPPAPRAERPVAA